MLFMFRNTIILIIRLAPLNFAPPALWNDVAVLFHRGEILKAYFTGAKDYSTGVLCGLLSYCIQSPVFLFSSLQPQMYFHRLIDRRDLFLIHFPQQFGYPSFIEGAYLICFDFRILG